MSGPLIANTGISGTGSNITPAVDTTGATLLIASVHAGAAVPLTDSKANVWVGCTARGAAAPYVQLFYVLTPIVGTGHTFTSPSAYNPAISVLAFQLTTPAIDINTGANATSPGSATPAHPDEVLIAATSSDTTGTFAVTGGFTIAQTEPYVSGVSYGGAIAYLLQTTAAAANPTWSGPAGNASAIASFTGAPAAASTAGLLPIL